MKIRILSVALVPLLFTACATTSRFLVLDAKTKLPVAGVAVRAVKGPIYSNAVLTSKKGKVVAPTLPQGVDSYVFRKSGYDTERVKVKP